MLQWLQFFNNIAIVIAALVYLIMYAVLIGKGKSLFAKAFMGAIILTCALTFTYIFHNQYGLISQGTDISLKLFINMLINFALLFYQAHLYRTQKAENERIRELDERIAREEENIRRLEEALAAERTKRGK